MPLSPGTKLGPYEILVRIGAGGMGEVYRAGDSKLHRDVAIKVLPAALASDAQYMARFEREAQVLASLNHANIAAIYGIEQGAIVMELVEGNELQGPLPLDTAVAYARQIAVGLEAAHEKGVIHRDLKPANIKVTADGVVKLLDFGLAKATEDGSQATGASPTISPTLSLEMTCAGMILGTAAYMAPEQARGAVADKRADIWAFGVVFLEMLTGKSPFQGETVSDTLAGVLRAPIDWKSLPAGTPPAVRRLLERCLVRDPKRRMRDIGEARIALENAGDAEVPPPALVRAARLPWVLAALAILLAAAASFRYLREKPPSEAALRLSVPLPGRFAVEYVALSPDGRTVAMVATSGSSSRLWLRALDSLELRPISDTDSARHPFWSPDSRSLGFFADGKLKIVAATGGPATALCDAGTGGGGAWNREGVILFGADNGPIQRVNAGGGVPSPVTQAEPGVRHLLPAFLPDGKHFLYVAQSTDKSKTGLYVAALSQPAGRKLLPDTTSAILASRRKGASYDFLLFQRENALMAQPFNVETFQLAGDPFPVARQLARTLTPAQVAASVAENGTLVYLAGPSRNETQLTWVDRSGKELGKVGPLEEQNGVALSPDQNIVARAYPASSSRSGLWLRELARDVETRFTLPPFVGPPVWSPDSSRIAFSGPQSLYVKNASGGPEQFLLQSGHRVTPSDWSRDGKYLLYTDLDPKTRGDIWYLPLDPSGKPGGAVAFLKTNFDESQGQFSADGHWVAYVSNESGQYEVYVRPFSSGSATTMISNSGGKEPRWRADGKELYYLSDSGLMAVSVQSRPGGLLQAGVPKALFDLQSRHVIPDGNLFSYSPSADGQRFLTKILPEAALATLNVITNWEKLAAGPVREP
jgi:Tol biopolymer transport system component/predicted Ser/Thr protein kinase